MERRKNSIRNYILTLLSVALCLALVPVKSAEAAAFPVPDYEAEGYTKVTGGEGQLTCGVTYTIYKKSGEFGDSYAALLEGKQTAEVVVTEAEHPTELSEVLSDYPGIVVFANYDTDGYNQTRMFYSCTTMSEFFWGSGFKRPNDPTYSYEEMFCNCQGAVAIHTNFTAAGSLKGMFKDCVSLTTVEFPKDTTYVRNMEQMFMGCTSLVTLEIPLGASAGNLQTTKEMFKGCTALTTVTLTGWKAFKTGMLFDMSSMFESCANLTGVNTAAISTAKVTDMSRAFYGCSSLEEIDLSGRDLSKVATMAGLFQNCTALKQVSFKDSNMRAVRNITDMFTNCNSIEKVTFGACSDTADTNGDILLQNCASTNMSIQYLDVSAWTVTDNESWTGESYKFDNLLGNVRSVKLPAITVEGFSAELGKTFYDRANATSYTTLTETTPSIRLYDTQEPVEGEYVEETEEPETPPEEPEEPEESETPAAVTPAAFTIWANGNKDSKSVTLTTTVKATDWTDSKGKTKAGKQVWLVMSKEIEPAIDANHKLTTKTDCKDIASINAKGVLSAKKKGGRVYVYAIDTGSKQYQMIIVDVKVAAKKITFTESVTSSAIVKKIAVNVGDEVGLGVLPKADALVVDEANAYTAKVDKEELASFLNVKAPVASGAALTVSFNALGLKDNKVTSVKFSVVNTQSGKKGGVTVQIYNSVSEVTGSIDKAIAAKGDTATITLNVNTKGGAGLATTDKAKVYVSPTDPVISGTKVTAGKSGEVKATLAKDGKSITVSASKAITADVNIYVVYTNSVTKTAQFFKVGTIEKPAAAQ